MSTKSKNTETTEVVTKSRDFQESSRNLDRNEEKNWLDFTRNFLPRWAANTKMKRGTSRDFFNIASMNSDSYESVIESNDKPDRINWSTALKWSRKWKRIYPEYSHYLKAAARGTLKNA